MIAGDGMAKLESQLPDGPLKSRKEWKKEDEPCPLFPDMNECPKIADLLHQLKNVNSACTEYRRKWIYSESTIKRMKKDMETATSIISALKDKEKERQDLDKMIWDEKCPNCGSTNVEIDFEAMTSDSDQVAVICQDCDHIFDVIQDVRFFLHKANSPSKCTNCNFKDYCPNWLADHGQLKT